MGVKESAKTPTFVLVDCGSELVDGWGHLQSLEKNSLLSLDSDVLWPLDETSKVSLGLDVSSETEVSWVLLEETSRTGGGTRSSLGLNDLLTSLNFLHLLKHNESLDSEVVSSTRQGESVTVTLTAPCLLYLP